MLAESGRGASGGGGGRLQAALAGGGTGAPGRPRGGASGGRVQQLVDAIIELGHLPTQCKKSSAEEKILAVRLIRARKLCSLSSKQEAVLDNLAQGAAQHLVDTIMELGYLPTQSKNSTLEEKQLAVLLIKACNAGSLSSKQEAVLGKLAEGTAEVGHMAGLQALHEAGLRPLPEAEARIAKAEELMQQVRDFGRCPRRQLLY